MRESETDTHAEDAADCAADYCSEDAARYDMINAAEIADYKLHVAKMNDDPNYVHRFNDSFCAVSGGNLSAYDAMTVRGE
jgi:hypothetical protein